MPEFIPTALILFWFGLPVVMWVSRLFSTRRMHGAKLYFLTVVIGYFAAVSCAWSADVVLEQRMNSFDLDGDGGIGGDELTPEAQQAMDEWASDTGRTLAIFTALPLSALWAAICLVPLCFGEWLVGRFTAASQAPTPREAALDHLPADDGNPYQTPGAG